MLKIILQSSSRLYNRSITSVIFLCLIFDINFIWLVILYLASLRFINSGTLSNKIPSLLISRYTEGYDIEDSTDRGTLYSFYKKAKALIAGENVDEAEANPASTNAESLSISVSSDVSLSPQGSPTHISVTSHETSITQEPENVLTTSLSRDTPTDSTNREDPVESPVAPRPESPQPSTSGLSTNVSNWDYSPFKTHLKIADSLIITRKFSKTKSKIPAAISGKDYFEYAAKVQEEKAQKLRAQEERKRKRLEKQETVKQKKKKATLRKDSSSENEEESRIEFDDSEEEIDLEENCCHACLGGEDWSINSEWIGCSGIRCNRWFHKRCISDDVYNMTAAELENYEYFCKFCERKRNF